MFPILTTVLLSATATGLPPQLAERGLCDSVDDDCIDGHVSLLQDSATLLKQQVAPPRASQASSAAAQSHLMVIALAAAVVGFVFYYFVVRPALLSARRFEERRSSQSGTTMGPQKSLAMERRPSILESFIVNHDNAEGCEQRKYDPLDEDAYSLAIALIVRDLWALSSGKAPNRSLRYLRLLFAIGLIAMTVVLQVLILVGTKMYVTPQQVAGIRDAYDQYEAAMYGEHVYLNKNGKHRGLDGFFNASAFDDLDDELQGNVCNIPLSQLPFLSLVLLVWSITCMSQIKKCVENFMAITFFADTTDSMSEALTMMEDEEEDDPMEVDDGIDPMVITGLTLPVKLMLIIFVFLPDFATTSYLLWLGSRWLVATNDFGNLISNAVALEFVLMLKCLLYQALVSERNRRDLDHTALAPSWVEEPAGYAIYFNTTVWAVLAVLFVWYYVYHQQVLPEYKWDVHVVCNSWLQGQLDPDNAAGF